MEEILTTVALLGTTLGSFTLALALARLGLAAMFRLLPATPRFVVISGGRSSARTPQIA